MVVSPSLKWISANALQPLNAEDSMVLTAFGIVIVVIDVQPLNILELMAVSAGGSSIVGRDV